MDVLQKLRPQRVAINSFSTVWAANLVDALDGEGVSFDYVGNLPSYRRLKIFEGVKAAILLND